MLYRSFFRATIVYKNFNLLTSLFIHIAFAAKKNYHFVNIIFVVYKDLSQLNNVHEDNKLIQPLCELIWEKFFFEESSRSSSFNSENINDRTFKVDSPEEFARTDCEFNIKIAFSFSVLLEHLLGRSPHFTVFIYYVTQLEDSMHLTFLAF